jgi:hypothetical protein
MSAAHTGRNGVRIPLPRPCSYDRGADREDAARSCSRRRDLHGVCAALPCRGSIDVFTSGELLGEAPLSARGFEPHSYGGRGRRGLGCWGRHATGRGQIVPQGMQWLRGVEGQVPQFL